MAEEAEGGRVVGGEVVEGVVGTTLHHQGQAVGVAGWWVCVCLEQWHPQIMKFWTFG